MDKKIEVLHSEAEIRARVAELGKRISRDYAGKELTVIGVLKGSFIFMADLVRAITIPVSCEFLSVSSYGNAVRSSGEVKLNLDIAEPLAGKHILIVEDIIDSGLTLQFLIELLSVRHPASLKVCALLDKPAARKSAAKVDYVGFAIRDEFVVGYGLDYAQKFRELPYIGYFPK